MTYSHTDQELVTVMNAIRKGWHVIPYIPDGKVATISWGYSTNREHLTTREQVDYYDSQGQRMAFVLSTASVALVDIDCAIPLYHDEACGRDYDKHRDDVHAEWDATPFDLKWQILRALENKAIKAGLEPTASMPSTSRNGYHAYYKCSTRKTDPEAIRKYLTGISTPDACIEIYANWRLAYPTNWEEMQKVVDCADPVPYDKVVKHWSPIADDFNTYRIMKRNVPQEPKPPVTQTATGFTTDYEQLVERSPYAQVGNKCRLFVWLVRAYQLGDEDGIIAGKLDAASRGLNERKIEDQARGARQFADSHPCRDVMQTVAYSNYKPRI